jgi:signal transduction histidine kinase
MLVALDVLPIFNALPEPYLVLSPELVIEAANDAYLAATGTYRDNLVGRHVLDALPDNSATVGTDGLHSWCASLAQVLASGQPHTMAPQCYEAHDLVPPRGVGLRHWQATTTLVRDAQGQPMHLIHHLLDITAQVAAEAQLRACQAREHATRTQAETQHQHANEALEATNQALRQTNARLTASQRELQLLNQDLELRVAERTQQLEDSLREAQQQRQQLGEQQQLLRQILSLVPAAVATFSGPEHLLTFFNDTYQAMVVKPVALATPAAVLFSEEVEKGFLTLLAEVYATGQPIVGHEIMARYLAASTEPRYLDFTYQALLGPAGQPTGVVASVIDVTDKVLARQQVQQLNEELATLNQELRATNQELHLSNLALAKTNEQLTRTNVDLDNFIYTASHDLKSPISNIDGLLLAVQHELPAAAQVGSVPLMLGMMRDAIERFKRTIAHLTDVSRLQKEHSQEASQVPLAALIAEVSLDLTPLLRETGGQFDVQVPEAATLTFSEKNLRSVVYNLLSNALKYHHPDRKPHVRVAYRTQETYQVLEVQDNGLGLDLTQGQAKLFAMFQRLHTHVDGSGIGLYMVKRIVENVGGRIEVASTLGIGSTFSVYFPG